MGDPFDGGTGLTASQAIQSVRPLLKGYPVYIAGSVVAAEVYDKPHAYSDLDVFCSSKMSTAAVVQMLIENGYSIAEGMKRLWERWLMTDLSSWHTHSIRLDNPHTGLEVNVIYKTIDGAPIKSLAHLIESFDYGLLAAGGYDMKNDVRRDLRGYLFPEYSDLEGALPMIPIRENDWRNGFISKYQGLRMAGRLVKYRDYGYDMSLCQDLLIEMYENAGHHLKDRIEPDKKMLGEIYLALSAHLSKSEYDKIKKFSKKLAYKSDLDALRDEVR